MDLIRIKGLELDCIVGVRPLEREREQRVRIDLALGLDTRPAGRTGRIALTCDYDIVAEQVIAMLRFRRYHLIEMATEELAAMLLGIHPVLGSVEIHLDKPAALDGRARAASVEIRRVRSDFPGRALALEGAQGTALLETREAGLYRLELAPGATLGPHLVRGEAVLEWLVSGSATDADGTPADGIRTRDGETATPRWQAGHEGAALFRCIAPPLAP
jgi:FolB domain-containing protein